MNTYVLKPDQEYLFESLKDFVFDESSLEPIEYRMFGVYNPHYGCKHTEEVKRAQSNQIREQNLGRKWFNNGVVNKFQLELPGPEWKVGRLNQKPTTKGWKWFNDGIVSRTFEKHPGDGWVPGCLFNRKN